MQKQKFKALKTQAVLNNKAHTIKDALFQQHDFFDPHDLLQVKYEMLRRVLLDKHNVAQTARNFGFSRTAFYKLLTAYQADGLAGLLPHKKGPQKAHKFSNNVIVYIRECIHNQPDVTIMTMVMNLKKEFGLTVHPRSVERVLKTNKKKR